MSSTRSTSRRVVALSAGAIALAWTAIAVHPGTALADTTPFNVPCPTADVVTPALDHNLIENPGAEDTTAYSTFGVSFPSGDSDFGVELPDCWTSSSTSTSAASSFGARPHSTMTQYGWSTSDPNAGDWSFYGGQANTASSTAVGTQTIDVSSLDAAGQKFALSGWLGGYNSYDDNAVVTATFEGSSGNNLGTATIGPVTPADRGNAYTDLYRGTLGTVPAGTTTVVITNTLTQPGTSGNKNNNGVDDDLNLTIGPDASISPPPAPITTVPYSAATGGYGLSRPTGVAASNGTVYVSNTGNNVIAALGNGATEVVSGAFSASANVGDGLGEDAASRVYQPTGLAVDGAGHLIISDTGHNTVRKLNLATDAITRLAGTGEAIRANGPLSGFGPAVTLDNPRAVAIDGSGDVFIADTDTNRVAEVLPNGQIRDVAGTGRAGYAGDGGPATAAELNQPTGLAVDSAGDLFIADSANNVVREVDATTHTITTVAGNVAADQANDGKGGFSGDGGPATSAQLDDPRGVAVDEAGDLFVVDTLNNAIREVGPDGTISTVVNRGGTGGAAPSAGSTLASTLAASRLNEPEAIAIDASTGTMYVADTGNDRVVAINGLADGGVAAGKLTAAGVAAPFGAPPRGVSPAWIALGSTLAAAALAAPAVLIARRRRRRTTFSGNRGLS